MKKLHLFSLLLAVLMAASAFSCGSGTENPKNPDTDPANTSVSDTDTEAPEPTYWEELGEQDFEGKTFTMIGVHTTTAANFADDTMTGEVVNDALHMRDAEISDMYNIKLEFIPMATRNDVANKVRPSIFADEDAYQLVAVSLGHVLRDCATGGLLYDLNSLPTLQLDREWWAPFFSQNTVYKGKIFMTLGDIAPMTYYCPYALAFNTRLAEDYKLPDLYQLTLDGKWTNDKMIELTKDLAKDLDGDSDIDYDDFFPYAFVRTNVTGGAHYVGAGGTFSTNDGETVELTITDERSINIMESVSKIFSNTYIQPYSSAINVSTREMFMEDRALFFGNSMTSMIVYFREMESDFGILPVPKLDEAQDGYRTFINIFSNAGLAVPKTIRDPEMVGFVMEALAYKSYETVRPAMYENLLKVKVARDDANAQVLDLVYNNLYIDMNGLYSFGGSADLAGQCVASQTMDTFMSQYEGLRSYIDSSMNMTLIGLSK